MQVGKLPIHLNIASSSSLASETSFMTEGISSKLSFFLRSIRGDF